MSIYLLLLLVYVLIMKKKVSSCSLNPSYVFYVMGNVRLLNKIAASAREVTTDASSLRKLQVDFQGPLDQVRFDYISLFILYDAHKLHYDLS